MNDDLLQRILRLARGADWREAPDQVRDSVAHRPSGIPPEPVSEAAARGSIPTDIRSRSSLAGAESLRFSERFEGLTLSLLVIPPAEGVLWRIEGLAVLDEPGEGPLRVTLVRAHNVMAETIVDESGRFAFEEVLSAGWSLELRWGTGEAVLEGPSEE